MKRPVRAQKMEFNLQKVVTQHQEDEKELREGDDNAKWLTHYCSDHQILLVGDGDFSFSLCLAKAFGSASNIVASSLDTYGEVTKKYKDAKSNLDELHKLGACVLHGVDANKLKFYPDLNMRRFDRVIFNFPHAGFHGKEDNLLLIKMHRDLVLGFFKNASRMLRANGEIHVNHKTTPPFDNWNIEKLAMESFLILIECVDFNKEDYPGYNNKRGDSTRCDEPFPLGECSTFKFIYNPRIQKSHMRRNDMEVSRQQTSFPFQEIQSMEQLPATVDLNCYPQTITFAKTNEVVRPIFDLRNGYTPISGDYNNVHVKQIYGRIASSADMRNGYTPISSDYNNVTEIHRRVAWRNGYTPISRDYFNNVTDTHGRVASSAELRNGYTPISRDYFNNVTEMHGRVASSAELRNGYTPISMDYFNNVTDTHGRVASSAELRNGYTPISRDYFNNVTEMHGRVASSAELRNGYTPISRDYFNNVTEMHGRVASSAELRNRYTPISRDYFNNVTETHGRVASSAEFYYRDRNMTLDSRRMLQPVESLQPLQMRPTSINIEHCSSRRTMDIAPSLSIGARIEDYKYQVFGGSSRYLQEELRRTAAERYIADGARKTYKF